MLIACTLNFLHSLASVALDLHAAAGHRQHARAEISDTLARLPTPGLIAQLINLAAPSPTEPPPHPAADTSPAASATGIGATD